jgi:carbonic anhydrase
MQNKTALPTNITIGLLFALACLINGCGETKNSNEPVEGEPKPNRAADKIKDDSKQDDSHHYFHKQEQPHSAEWSYGGDSGPSHWAGLSEEYALAKTGKHQSPINLTGAKTTTLPSIDFDYRASKIDLVYNGHTVEEVEDKASSIGVDGKTFVLQQFHFHAPSEHTIDGKHSDMEMHLVHKGADGSVAVIGVMINVGSDNPAFDAVWDYLPSAANRERKESVSVDAATLLPQKRGYYRYTGSFTTPPCTEEVLWMVMADPIELSKTQIDRFRMIINDNNRPVQILNNRQIELSKE